MALLGREHYTAIRAALDTALTAADLSDDVIAEPIFVAEAEAEVLGRDAAAAGYTEASARWWPVRRAAIYLTAARLALSWNPPIETGVPDLQLRWQAVAPELRAARLRALAERQLASYLESDAQTASYGLFWRAPGTRGQ